MRDRRRVLPSVDLLLRSPLVSQATAGQARGVVARAVRDAIARFRPNPAAAPADEAGWAEAVADQLRELARPTLRRCINATGVVLHTNLGRAPLAAAAANAVSETAAGYASLEFDVESGRRGSRHVHCTGLLTELTGAADAMVVNNAASALLLALAVAAEGACVAVSRGELIEIGGGFRIPDILTRSGARLVEVGTTNRTTLQDYERALRPLRRSAARAGRRRPSRRNESDRVKALLKVHRSNFAMVGFVGEVDAKELAALGRKRRVPVIFDLGGGLMADLADVGLAGEPTLRDGVRSGATAVVASGDKLLGGPQAGVLLGARRFVTACRNHPLARALRADKLTLAGLAATLMLYRDPDLARSEIPVLRMLTATVAQLEESARALAGMLPRHANAAVVRTDATVGGGAFPGATLESRAVAVSPDGVEAKDVAGRLRRHATPVIATVREGRVLLDVRTILPGELENMAAAVAVAVA